MRASAHGESKTNVQLSFCGEFDVREKINCAMVKTSEECLATKSTLIYIYWKSLTEYYC